MCLCPFTDERGQRRNHIRSRDPIKEELPKGNPEFATGLFETGEGVPTTSSNADFHGEKSINIFRSRAPYGYWKTTSRFCNQEIFDWSRAASRKIGL
jgi:hypothetical protein